jgi:hypothetical protein
MAKQDGRCGICATPFDEERHSGESAGEETEERLRRGEARATLREALERLAPEFREVIVLRELSGLSYREIAEATRSPIGTVMSRLARAIALRDRPFDHTSAMIRNDPRDPGEVTNRKANSLGVAACGFARVHRFVDGWFPPEGRAAIMHLCHATRAEAVASIVASPPGGSTIPLGRAELGQGSLVEQNEQLIHKQAVSRKGQQQSRV